jgi:BirA family biotin operon repressor/biotin-[acetyl-CoA-carboxylase] ligase
MLSTCNKIIEQRQWYDFKELSSTNDELKKHYKDASKIIITAQNQTNGRGRLGRTWKEANGNLYFSYGLEISPQNLSNIVCLIGLSLAKTIQDVLPNKDIKIKWPNDIVIENKKISGILLENIKDNLWCVGIGVNIQTAPILDENSHYKATSIKDEGIVLDRIEFLQYYLKNFNQDYKQYQIQGFDVIKKQWLQKALNINQQISIVTGNKTKQGTFITIDDAGYLVLKVDDKEEKIIVGDMFI